MKTLVVVAHPDIETSAVNKKWMEELKQYPDKYTVHELYKAYPEGEIDVKKEQELIETHGNLVLQFPIYWFNSPPLLKKWLDDVLTEGWAFGSNGGNRLMNRKVALAVTAGAKRSQYSEKGKFRYTLEQVLVPFEITMMYCDADYRGFYAFYDSDGNKEEGVGSEETELSKSAGEYVHFLDGL